MAAGDSSDIRRDGGHMQRIENIGKGEKQRDRFWVGLVGLGSMTGILGEVPGGRERERDSKRQKRREKQREVMAVVGLANVVARGKRDTMRGDGERRGKQSRAEIICLEGFLCDFIFSIYFIFTSTLWSCKFDVV